MSNKKDKSEEPKKSRGLLKTLLMGLLLLGAGGGTVFGLMAAGILGDHPAKADESGPQLVLKGEGDPYAPPPAKGETEAVDVVYGEGGSKYRTAYYSFSEEFTSNLKDSDALVQMSLAASTHHDGRVLMWLGEHELAIRSRILIALADTPEEAMYSPQGKIQLQKRLTDAVNEVLTEREGFGGVDNVYFKNFIVQ